MAIAIETLNSNQNSYTAALAASEAVVGTVLTALTTPIAVATGLEELKLTSPLLNAFRQVFLASPIEQQRCSEQLEQIFSSPVVATAVADLQVRPLDDFIRDEIASSNALQLSESLQTAA